MTDRIGPAVARLADLVDGPRAYFDVIALGERAIAPLAAMLSGPPTTVHQPRCLAADAIAQIGGPAGRDALLGALADSTHRVLDPVLRAAEDVVASRIAEHLGAYDEAQVRDALRAVLHDHPYPGCVRALARLREVRAAPLLARWLSDDTIRAVAAEALARLGVAALADATRVLVCPCIVAGLEPPSCVDARIAAASIVAAVGADASALPLAWSLWDEQASVRRAAALALVGHAGACDLVAPILIEGLASESWVDRDAAANALRDLGAGALVVVAEAVRGGGLPRDGTIAAVRLLADGGTIAPLGELSGHPDPHVRFAAVDALASLDGAEARAALARFARDPEPAIRRRVRHSKR